MIEALTNYDDLWRVYFHVLIKLSSNNHEFRDLVTKTKFRYQLTNFHKSTVKFEPPPKYQAECRNVGI